MSESRYQAHLFVCTNRRSNGKDCFSKGGESLRTKLKGWCRAQGLQSEVRVNSSGCLDACERGIVAVNYPSGEWLEALTDTPEGEERLRQSIRNALTKDPSA